MVDTIDMGLPDDSDQRHGRWVMADHVRQRVRIVDYTEQHSVTGRSFHSAASRLVGRKVQRCAFGCCAHRPSSDRMLEESLSESFKGMPRGI